MERPVRESNPSHSRDSGAATPVASRAFKREPTRLRVTDGDRTRLRRVTACPRRQTSTVTMRTPVGRRGVAPRSLGLQPSAITRPAHDPLRARSRAPRAPAEGIEPSRVRLTAGCLTIRLRWNGQGAGASRPPVVWHRVVKEQCPLAEGRRIRCTRAASRPGIHASRSSPIALSRSTVRSSAFTHTTTV